MLFRPWFILYRNRLIAAAAISLLFALLTFFIIFANNFRDIGVFWHDVCNCPLNPRDAGTLVNPFYFISLILPAILGIFAGATPGLQGDTRFLLTRPLCRRNLIVQPLLIVTAAIAILLGFGWLLLLGWLKLVHAPALGHLVALLEMAPSASMLGSHPSFFALMAALHMTRRWMAALSVSLCYYAIFASQRWLLLNPGFGLRLLGLFPLYILLLSPLLLRIRFLRAIMLWVPKGADALTYLPSSTAIALHFAFAAAVLYGSWRLLLRAQIS